MPVMHQSESGEEATLPHKEDTMDAHQPPVYSGTSTTIDHSHDSATSSHFEDESHGKVDDVERQDKKRRPFNDLGLAQTKSEGGPIYIEFELDDPENPQNWASGRKMTLAFSAFLYSASTAVAGTGYNSLQNGATMDLHCSPTVFLFGNTLYLSVGVAFTPLLLAPLSEMFGRMPIFLTASLFYALFFIPQALTQTTSGLLISRLLLGCTASVGNSLVGGTVSDLYAPKDRGLAMSLFALSIYFGQAIGPAVASYTMANPQLGWRWALGIQGFIGVLVFILLAIFLRETRGSVILSRRARAMTEKAKATDGRVYRCSADDDQVDFWNAVKVSLSRPAWWLISEPIVTFFSLWVGFLWGAIFLMLESVPIVFGAYGWSDPQKSLVLLCLAVGSVIGWLFSFHQEKLYARAAAKAAPNKPPPEARLYWACVGGVLTPVAFFIFAWTGRPGITPVAPIIGLVIFCAATFWIYIAVFTYIAECYEIYASSGLAAQSWLRNVLAGTFPLFAPAMYRNLSPPIASTVLGVIAAILGVCPFVLFFYGKTIRSKSKVAKALALHERETMERMQRERAKNERREKRHLEKDRPLGEQ